MTWPHVRKNNITSSNNIWNFPIQRKSEPQGNTSPAAGQQRCKMCVLIFLQTCVVNLAFQILCQTAGHNFHIQRKWNVCMTWPHVRKTTYLAQTTSGTFPYNENQNHKEAHYLLLVSSAAKCVF